MSNSDFFKSLKTTNVRYMLCDLHVHSIASADVLIGDRYDQLDATEKELIESLNITKENFSEKWGKYDQLVAEKINPENYLNLLIDRRNKIAHSYDLSSGGRDWAVVAITDHNSCKFSCKLSKHAWDTIKIHRIIILPGLELEVEFKVKDEYVKIHICLVFAPCVEEAQIYGAVNSAHQKANSTKDLNWNFGEIIKIERIEDFIKSLRRNNNFPALCVAAHIESSKGIQRETKDVFTRTQAEYARLIAELEEIAEEENSEIEKKSYKIIDIEKKISALEPSLGDADIETLKIIGKCGFDALQVSNRDDDTHYRCLHRFKPEQGRAVTILSSDAHRLGDVFNCGNNFISYIKFPPFNSQITQIDFFKYLKDYSIKFGETRFTSVPEKKVNCFIRGIDISPDTVEAKKFWPFENDKLTIPFSPNLNCLIGGRGSGKSAMIEALAFILEPKEFNEKISQSKDWYKRSVTTLAGCKIKICWVSSNDNFQLLKKKSLFADRFFTFDNRYANTEYRDMDGNEITDEAIKSDCKIQLFRMGDLEKYAVDDVEMRKLFDGICGTEIERLGEEIQRLLTQLKDQKQNIETVFHELSELTRDGSPLRKYIIRKKQYDDVNTKEMKTKFDKLDQAIAAKQIADQAKQLWDEFGVGTTINQLKNNAVGFFDDVDNKTKDADGKTVLNTNILRQVLFDKGDQEKSSKDEFLDNIDILHGSVTKTSSAIVFAHTSIGDIAKTERDSLEEAGMPTGSLQRRAKKTLFNESEQALENYKRQRGMLRNLYKKRIELFKQVEELAKKRTQLRVETAQEITKKLRKNLDASVLEIEADAQAMADKKDFSLWLNNNLFPPNSQHKDKKIESLLEKGLLPETFRKLLLGSGDPKVFVVKEELKVSEGRIDEDAAKSMIEHAQICYKFAFDEDIREHKVNKEELPETIQKGIKVFTEDQSKFEAFLQLDEIVFDDIPEIRLKDRPGEMDNARPITELSPGQRCSAILPIILLNGECPLIIDQPEDNLDNRLVREVVVNILAAMKLQRQIIMATHNSNLPVLGDVEQAIILKAVGQDRCEFQAIGDIDNIKVISSITEIMEGGREAFQYRQSIYQTYWDSYIEE